MTQIQNIPDQRTENRRASALHRIMEVTGEPAIIPASLPLDVRVSREELHGNITVRWLTYQAEPGQRVPACLLLPTPATARGSAVLCLHQTTHVGKLEPAGLAGDATMHYAMELAQRGHVTLAPDFPGFGDFPIPDPPRFASRMIHGVVNHRRAVDLLQSLPGVDPSRIGCVGHSLGGHNALFLAAFEPRLRATVCSCGMTTWRRYADLRGDLADWASPIYMPRIASVFGNDPARMPFDFEDLIVAVAPRAVFIFGAERDHEINAVGIHETQPAAETLYEKLGKPERVRFQYADIHHAFPLEVHVDAYEFVERFIDSPE